MSSSTIPNIQYHPDHCHPTLAMKVVAHYRPVLYYCVKIRKLGRENIHPALLSLMSQLVEMKRKSELKIKQLPGMMT